MKPRSDPETAEWLRRAADDLRAVDLMRPHGLNDLVCFHAQQIAEKSLKAVLVARGQVPARTYHLPMLLDALRATGLHCDGIEQDAILLTPYAVVARYPGFGQTDAKMAATAQEAAHRVYEFVEKAFEEGERK